ncbi:uncharacterized protein J8A68_005748 [[Candida] subhashii]|uniref:Uncharacterized protein n=1 Tax=[Candida] subhashii TaxID=561895 RepID=A0A8J5Q5L0_9ASCO|nr:uncharacterized protein J8A68_005748 [[Candida] subhashii]KAG7660786.1 hypothetical protein J8A68_005748 [[Candida] subhashii]
MPQYIRHLLFADDFGVPYQTLDDIVKRADKCSIRFQTILMCCTEAWLQKHQERSVSEYHLFGDSAEAKYQPENKFLVRHLVITLPTKNWLEKELPKFEMLNSVSICVTEYGFPIFTEFALEHKVRVNELRLRINNSFQLEDILSNFEVWCIKRFQIRSSQISLLQTMLPFVHQFCLLESLAMEFRRGQFPRLDDWVRFFEKIPQPLAEIVLESVFQGICDRASTGKKRYLKILSLSSIDQVAFRSGGRGGNRNPVIFEMDNFPALKLRDINLDRYFSLEKVIVDGRLFHVSKSRSKYLTPAEFHANFATPDIRF